MAKAARIQDEIRDIATIDRLAQTFKGISSIYISRTKDQVLASKSYFSELWSIYQQLRADPRQRITTRGKLGTRDKNIFIVIASESALTGDIDQRIIGLMMQDYDPNNTDVVAIGSRGAVQLKQKNIPLAATYKLPESINEHFDPAPVIASVREYARATAYYPIYQSLTVQKPTRVDLVQAVQSLSEGTQVGDEIISPRNYIFEPSAEEIIAYMEDAMLQIAFSQFVFESKLAQFASRFNAMSHAHDKAQDMSKELKIDYHRAKRHASDERLKEIVNTVFALNRQGGGAS